MRKRSGHEIGRDSGQALIMFAVFLLGLVAMLALGLDGGNIYLVSQNSEPSP